MHVCTELLANQEHSVTVVWMHDDELAGKLAHIRGTCVYVREAPNARSALKAARVEYAEAILVLSDDDQLNLQVALLARDINPRIRIVMRQFNRRLGQKLEENLPNCSVLSLASHSAATFAAVALVERCVGAFLFPDPGGVLTAFATGTAQDFGITGCTPPAAEQRLSARVFPHAATGVGVFKDADEVTVFARIERLEAVTVRGGAAGGSVTRQVRARDALMKHARRVWEAEPLVLRVIAATAAIFVLAVVYFAFALGVDAVSAIYFVATTFTSTGYGDITPYLRHAGPVAMLTSSALMFTGVAAIGIFIAFATAALTRAQFTAIQGLRQIRTRDHILICGAGNVGTRVIEYLRAIGKRVVIVEMNPNALLVEMSQQRRVELVTSDATRDGTLDFCNVDRARAVIAVTDSDTANLEVALGVRARSARVPVVMRVRDDEFARSINRHFPRILTHSTAALAAPVFGMIARRPGMLGRVRLGADEYDVAERLPARRGAPADDAAAAGAAPAAGSIPLGVWRDGVFLVVDAFTQTRPSDRVLFLIPRSQCKPVSPQNGEPVAAEST